MLKLLSTVEKQKLFLAEQKGPVNRKSNKGSKMSVMIVDI